MWDMSGMYLDWLVVNVSVWQGLHAYGLPNTSYTYIFGLALAWSLNCFDICMVNEVKTYNYVYVRNGSTEVLGGSLECSWFLNI